MKNQFRKLFLFFKKEHFFKYLIEIAFFFSILVLFLALARNDVISNVIGTIIGFVFSTALMYIVHVIMASLEDILKVNKDSEALLKVYKEESYRKTLTLNGTDVTFAYADLLVDCDYEYEVIDDPDKMFCLDEFIMNNYETLFLAHTNSTKINSTTIRLDDLVKEGNKVTFHLSRSTVFNHLLTNRAVDFVLFDSLTLRDVYEYGPKLSPLNASKMSNHIGINALVFLSDGTLIVPRRSRTSTISKNQITSSIAVKLELPQGSETVTTDYLIQGNIIENLTERTHIPSDALNLDHITVKFLGMGQSLYEGGKPQFYYSVVIHDIDAARYHQLSAQNESVSRLDVDKCIYTVDYASYRFKKDAILFDIILPNGHKKRMKTKYEMSYLCNLWHYEEFKKANSQESKEDVLTTVG